MADRPGLIGFRIAATESDGIDWARIDETWSHAAELPALDAGWMSDHLSDATRQRGGPALEAFTAAAALAGRVRGKWVGIAVASSTFRHPALVAKAATVLDNVTGGRFVLGMGAGWHAGEHDAFGIALPPPPERFDRLESSLKVVSAMFSAEAASEDGVTLDDPIWPLRGATNLPGPTRPGGPPIWLGVGGRRGIALAARYAQGWPMPGNRPGELGYFIALRDRLRSAISAEGRDPDAFCFAAQIVCGSSSEGLRAARESALAFRRAGATHIILGLPARDAPDGLNRLATEVAEPVLAAAG